jgi:hypothetical protein
VFGNSGGAKSDFDAYGEAFRRTPAAFDYVTVPSLGDAADGITFRQTGGIRFFRIAWRDRNATASITVQGFDGKLRLADALRLARKQEAHFAAVK